MKDKEMYDLLEKFINDSPMAEHIKVEITGHSQSYKPKYKDASAHYEDAKLLSSVLMGAEHLMFWLRRNKYEIRRKK